MKRSTFALISIGCLLLAGVPAVAGNDPLGLVSEDRKEYEHRLTQQLERLLARLRAATTAEEKQRLERAIVEFVRGELRGTWLAVGFTLQGVDAEKHSIRVVLTGTTLVVDGLPLAKDAKVWLDEEPGRLADLSVGMAVALQLTVDAGQRRVIGIRAGKGRGAAAAAEVDRLIRQLGSDTFEEREAASRALVALGKSARPALARAARTGDAEVRARARRLLVALENKENTWYFSAGHEAPPDLAQRCSIIEADGKAYCVNERGERSRATVSIEGNQLEMNALDWGLKGRIEMDREGARIKWANGSKWTQKRP
jgi:hypothetical protein